MAAEGVPYYRRVWSWSSVLLVAIGLWTVATVPSRAASVAIFDDPPVEAFEPTGLQPHKPVFSQLPFEAVDMVNGGLMLTFTDLALPGDAGMDLRILRSFNNQVNGGWWQMGIAGVPVRVSHPDGNGQGCCEWPTLIMADGAQHVARPRDQLYGESVFLTDQFWRYTTTSTARTLELPNGWVATYELGVFSGGAMLVELHDPFGNSITPTWVGGGPNDIRPLKLASVQQTVGGTSRTVTFTYGNSACPHTIPSAMTYAGRTWSYGCEFGQTNPNAGQRITSVTPPEGAAWEFSYVNGLAGALTVTTPRGGTVTYDFSDQELPVNSDVHRSVVATRTTGGHEIVPGTWTFSYEQSATVPARGTVAGPGGRSVEFTSEWASSPGKFVLSEKVLRDGTTVVATATRAYETLPHSTAFPSVVFPVPGLDTLQQDGATYTVDYHYASSSFGDYHQPWKIVEAGQLTRTTERTFVSGFTPYIPRRVASESVSVAGGGTYTKSWDYDLTTGFVEAETVYGETTTFSPDGHGNRASATDAENQTTAFTYEFGVVKNTIMPEYTITRSINADGTVASETQGGATTFFDYDDLGRVVKVWPPVGDPIDHGYEPDGHSDWVQRGQTWTTTHRDGFGRSIGTETAAGVRTSIAYDADGRKTYESYPYSGSAGGGNAYTYDALNRVTRIDKPGGAWVGFTHTATTVAIRDENGHVTTQAWAAFGSPGDRRLMGVEDAGGESWAYAYTALGGLTEVAGPNGLTRTWAYTGGHQVASETHPESGTVSYAYDGVGNLVSKTTQGTGVVVTYAYDDNHRLTSINAPGTDHDVTLGYDARDNRTSVANGTVTSTLVYDGANRLTQRTDVIAGESFVTNYGYDARDNLTTVTYPSSRVVTNTYDALGDRLTAVASGGTTWASHVTYAPSGALTGYTSGNGTTTTISYDARQRPTALASGPLSLSLAYDPVGNVTAVDDTRAGFDQTFGYDVVDRLTTVTGFGAATYTYDAHGNRTARNGVASSYTGAWRLASDGAQSYTYDGAGQTLTAGAQTYTYTPLQQVATATVGGATTTYRYDGDNQRRLRVRADGTQEYFVPGPGLVPLAEYRKAPGGARVLVREYIYAGDRLIASVGLEPVALPSVAWTDDPIVPGVTAVKAVHLTELRDAVNAARVAHGLAAVSWTDATVAPGLTVIQAVHVAELRTAINAVYVAASATAPTYTDSVLVPGVTDIRAVHLTELRAARANAPAEIGATRYYHLDALGSVRAVTDAAGATVRRHDYAAFGEAPTPGLGADARRFAGKERDAETGLDYFSARYYGVPTGRFTTPDPGHVGGDIFDPQSWNAYAYARNNPLRFVDPTGTDYLVLVDGGRPFWIDNDSDLWRYEIGGFTFKDGHIFDATGARVGGYQHFDKAARLFSEIGRRAAPVETIVSGVLGTFGSIVAPVPTGVAWCLAASNCSSGGLVVAGLPPSTRRILGTLLPLADKPLSVVIRMRGGGGLQVNKVATRFQHLRLGDVATKAAAGDREAAEAIKIAKNARRLHDNY